MSDDVGLHENDIGAVIELTVKEPDGSVKDISSATTKQLKFTKSSGVGMNKDAVFTTDGTDGKIRYTTVDGDLTPPGTWFCRAYLVLNGWTGHTSRVAFDVYRV